MNIRKPAGRTFPARALALAGAALLLSTCQDFFGTADLKQQIKDDVIDATAPTVTVIFQRPEKTSMGTTTPPALVPQTLKVGIPYDITTTVGDDYTFLTWQYDNGDLDFHDINSSTTSLTINSDTDSTINITPTFDRRPYIFSKSPASEATNVLINSSISIRFSEAIDPSSVALGDTIQVTTWPSGILNAAPEPIDTNFNILIDNAVVQLTPKDSTSYFDKNYTVMVSISSEITDMSGNGMAEDYSWIFKTGISTDTEPPAINNFQIQNSDSVLYDPDASLIYTRGTDIVLRISAADSTSNVEMMQIIETPVDSFGTPNGSPVAHAPTAFDDVVDFTINSSDQNWTRIQIIVADESGNWSEPSMAEDPTDTKFVLIDSEFPTISDFRIGSSEYVNQTTQNIFINGADGTGSPLVYVITSSSVQPTAWLSSAPSTIDLGSSDGVKTFYLHLKDAAGNWSYFSDSIVLDRTGPVATLGGTEGGLPTDLYVRSGIPVTISAEFDETLAGTPSVSITGTGVTSSSGAMAGSGTSWTYAWAPAGDGTAAIAVTAQDLAGNPATVSGISSYTVDNTPPTVAVSASTGYNFIRSGQSVTFAADFSDAGGFDASTVPTLSIPGIVDPAVTMVKVSDTRWTYLYTAGSGDVTGAAVAVTGGDRAGNTVASPTGVTSFTLDNTSPTVTVTSVASSSGTGWARVGQTVTLRFTVSDAGSGPSASAPTVTLAGHAVTPDLDAGTWEASWTMQAGDAEGLVAYQVVASDKAGNSQSTGTVNSAITFDRTGPVATLGGTEGGLPTDLYVRSGIPVTISAEFDETLAGTPSVSITGTGVTSSSGAMAGSGTSWTYAWTPAGDGTAAIAVTAQDLAGNPATVSGISSYTVDNTPPTVNTSTATGSVKGPAIAEYPSISFYMTADERSGLKYIDYWSGTGSKADAISASALYTIILSSAVFPASTEITADLDGIAEADPVSAFSFTVMDAAGNESPQSYQMTLSVSEYVYSGMGSLSLAAGKAFSVFAPSKTISKPDTGKLASGSARGTDPAPYIGRPRSIELSTPAFIEYVPETSKTISRPISAARVSEMRSSWNKTGDDAEGAAKKLPGAERDEGHVMYETEMSNESNLAASAQNCKEEPKTLRGVEENPSPQTGPVPARQGYEEIRINVKSTTNNLQTKDNPGTGGTPNPDGGDTKLPPRDPTKAVLPKRLGNYRRKIEEGNDSANGLTTTTFR